MDINSQHHNLLGTQISPKSEDFCILEAIVGSKLQGHHSKPKLSPYGAAYLTACKYPFPLKSVHVWIFKDFFKIFILVAIWKILKSKSTTLSDDLFLCQISKGSAVRFEFNIFCTLVTMATAAILNLFNPQQLPHTTVDILTKFHEVWWKESKTIFNLPFFVSMVAVAKFVQPIPIFLAYLVPLDVDVVPNKFHQLISKPQNYVYTCQTKFLESFIQFRAI